MKRFILSLFFLVFLFIPLSLWAQEIKVAVLPFEINAREDLSYVQEGIQDMLSTRLYVPGKIVVIDEVDVEKVLKEYQGPLNETLAREIGRKLGADYVIIGSLTTFGQKASLDAKLIPVKAQKPPLALYAYTDTLDDLIPKLVQFAEQGVAYMEGRPPQRLAAVKSPSLPSAPQPGPAAPTVSATPQAAAPKDVSKMHPERIFRTQGPPPTPPANTASATASASPKQQEVKASKYKYSDIDPWPDYPPEEEDLAPLVIESKTEKPKTKKKKKHFWSKLWPGNWFGKKEEEKIITPSGSVPPPPPPPGYQAQAPQTYQRPGSPPPPPPPPPTQPSYGQSPNYQQSPGYRQTPSAGGSTWQWY